MVMKYLFTFTPMGSFMFSGESSLASPNESGFLKGDTLRDKRKSFIVTSEKLPPQTTMMGAVRYLLLQLSGYNPGTDDADKLIGKSTFNLENQSETQDMGVIRSIGPVMLHGFGINNKELFFLPAPIDQKTENDDKSPCAYNPREKYSAKDYDYIGYFAWYKHEGKLKRDDECWYSGENFFASYTQALHATDDDGDSKDNQSFHMQERVRLIDRRLLSEDMLSQKKGAICDPSFCIEVELDEDFKLNDETMLKAELDKFADMFVSLGGRESTFKVQVKKFNSTWNHNDNERSKKFYLLSPAMLPENWRGTTGLEMAYLNTRRLRGAVTKVNSGKVSMTLNANRLIFADAGSVFEFDGHDNMENFKKKIDLYPITKCGFNRTAVL